MTTDNTITATVTFQDLIDDLDTDLADLRDAYDDVVAHATAEFGENRSEWPDDLHQQAVMYDQAAQTIQKRQHVLGNLRDSYDGDAFEIKMLSGEELIDIETQLRMEAQSKGVDPGALQALRQQLSVDAATVDAPGNVPREDESPVPSQCPNPLTMSLHEHVERLNTAGSADFRAEGFGETAASVGSASSVGPNTSGVASSDLDPSETTTRTPGDDS